MKTKILEYWKRWNKVMITILFIILIFMVFKIEDKIQAEVGREIKQIVSTVEMSADLLDSTKSEEAKIAILEMAYNSIKNSEEAIEALTKDSLLLSGYDIDELSFYILTSYGEENIDIAHEKLNELNKFIHDTGIKKIIENKNYNYFFDSRDVKQMIKDINDYCYME